MSSGSTDFNSTRSQIINRAMRVIGILSKGQVAPSDEVENASDTFNAGIKALQNEGVRLWTRDWIAADTTASSIVTGSDSLYYKCTRGHTSTSDTAPVSGKNWTLYWEETTTSGSAHALATVYTSQNEITLPAGYIKVDKAYVRINGSDRPLKILSYTEYLDINTKTSQGSQPVYLALDEGYSTVTGYLYPYPSDTNFKVNLLAVSLLEDYDANGDTGDFPVRWINTLVYMLADSLADEYHVPTDERMIITAKYLNFLKQAKSGDREVNNKTVRSAYDV